jgi:pimeloyl-ACP methyl ester carboxylesterase
MFAKNSAGRCIPLIAPVLALVAPLARRWRVCRGQVAGWPAPAPAAAAVLAAGQRPASAAQLSEPSGAPAWKTIPSWALLGTLDHVIPPALQQRMYEHADADVSRVKAGHLSLITRPDAVVRVILSAVEATT